MLRIAVQSKGRLFDDTMNLLAEADIKVPSSKRTLLVQSTNFPLEVLYLSGVRTCRLSLISDSASVVYHLPYPKHATIKDWNGSAGKKSRHHIQTSCVST